MHITTTMVTALAGLFISRSYAVKCGGFKTPAGIDAARLCAEILYNRGSKLCSIDTSQRAKIKFCGTYRVGEAEVWGSSVSEGSTYSTCRDVSLAVSAIIDQCALDTGTVHGSEFANGNGDFLIELHRMLDGEKEATTRKPPLF